MLVAKAAVHNQDNWFERQLLLLKILYPNKFTLGSVNKFTLTPYHQKDGLSR
ncbi:hypothetical protein CLV24_103296 [Pontibacter ummariensis]|uniref:Uncharacterized protein n=1 Tax=Pontibacter ummariensis TaxID=1610492 RepID=A0A239CGJ5_9BACT|nr:hypothetical protein CLV24_103296 [Pontibacter ummariensis]SNS18604.1 hypothetical protein SAMN06296052_10317 [Pontibacter ummariensis]